MDNTTLNHRVKAYPKTNTPGAETILVSGHTTELEANRLLDQLAESGIISGGYVERHLQGFGWILATETEAEHDDYPRGPTDIPG